MEQMQMEGTNRLLLKVNTVAGIAIRIDSAHLDTQGREAWSTLGFHYHRGQCSITEVSGTLSVTDNKCYTCS